MEHRNGLLCAHCGTQLAPYQVDAAVLDAGYLFDDTWPAHLTLYCSSYDDEHGCAENDPDDAACFTDDQHREEES